MSSDYTFRTITSTAQGVFKDRGSKFFAYAFPVKSENAIKDILKDSRKKYHDARHHCYAYRLGELGDIYRINDDGEPSGTAGRPIYGQILSKDLTNVLIIVVRYFGGTLLGTSGLINAYRSASEDCLSNAVIVNEIIKRTVKLEFPYDQMSPVMKIIKEENISVEHRQFDQLCHLEISVPKSVLQHSIDRFMVVGGMKLDKI